MTDLTEKSKIKEGYYYAIVNGEQNIVKKVRGLKHPYCNGFCCDCYKYLSPVPSYEEWQASENYIDYLKQCISVYESKDKQATETSIAYNELLEENTKLKELLKECKHIMSIEKDFASCHFEKDKLCKLLAKINQALGEECELVGIEKQVWESTLNRSMVLQAENDKLKTDCKTLAQKLLQVKPELREWLEVNFKEYL